MTVEAVFAARFSWSSFRTRVLTMTTASGQGHGIVAMFVRSGGLIARVRGYLPLVLPSEWNAKVTHAASGVPSHVDSYVWVNHGH